MDNRNPKDLSKGLSKNLDEKQNALTCKALSDKFDLVSDPAGTRTQDPYIKSVMLYQLSYGIIYPSKHWHRRIPF